MSLSEPFGERGQRLHDDLLRVKAYNPAEMVLVVEVCRMADRLEQLDGIIHGKGVINLMHLRHMGDDESEITMTVDGVLAEARQLQLAFQRVAMTLNIESGAMPEAEVDTGDDLAAQRAARIAKATGS
jgi:hypothetical protein